jgi:flagellar biosynthesis protein FliQ
MLARQTLELAIWISLPILVVATAVSLIISVVQVLTSIQDSTVSTVPRLAAVAVVSLILMPFFMRKLVSFMLHLFENFHRYVG